MSSIWTELKRRNVIRVGTLYVVLGWFVLQVGDVLFGLLGVPEWGLRLLFGILLLGLPLVLIFSWVFEMTPEGLKLESEIDRDASITPQTGRRIDRLIITGLVAVVAVLAVDRILFMPGDPAPTDEAAAVSPVAESGMSATESDEVPVTIAVLPFVNMSADEENEYFSDGLTEELLNLLAKIGELRVSSRTSSFTFKGKDASISDVAEQLNVAHVLEGSVRKAGNQVRITAQLIDVETDSHLWSETYDRQLDDIFEIQDEIAAAVVDALRVRLLSGEGPISDSSRVVATDIYDLYLRGRHLYNLGKDIGDVELIRQAIAIFEAALAANPEYALAYAGLADAYGRLAIEGEYSMAEGYERSREMARKALDIDPNLVEALLALADIQLEYDWDMRAAEDSYLRALAIRPGDAEGLRTYGYFLAIDGRYDEAIEYYRRAIEVDPMQTRAYFGLGNAYFYGGRFEELRTLLAAELGTSFKPILPQGWRERMERGILRLQERDAELIEMMGDQEPRLYVDLLDMAIAHHRLGNVEESTKHLSKLIELVETRAENYGVVAAAYAQIGELDLALDYLQKSVDAREPAGAVIRSDRDLSPLWNDQRYLDLLESIGLESPPSDA
jgi:TolB-like protein/Tfp pilus assembly protein PilF